MVTDKGTVVLDTDDKLLEQLLQDAEAADEPGASEDRTVHRPDATLATPIVSVPAVSAGHVFIYDTRTGERSITNRNMLVVQLKKKRKDGSTVFTTVKPAIEPVRGTIKCLLHTDDTKRAEYEAMGFPTCRKSNMPSHFQLVQHMAHDHRVEWATIEEQRARLEKLDDRKFQRSLVMLAAKRGRGPAKKARKARVTPAIQAS